MNIHKINYRNENELREAFVEDIYNDFSEILTYKGEEVVNTSFWTLNSFLDYFNFNDFLVDTMIEQFFEYDDNFLDCYNSFKEFLEERYDLENITKTFIEQIFYNEYFVDLKN